MPLKKKGNETNDSTADSKIIDEQKDNLVAQKGGKKSKAKEIVDLKSTDTATKSKVLKVPKEVKEVKEVVNEKQKHKSVQKDGKLKKTEDEDEEELDNNGKKIRSFKVKLPDTETFDGRFTGLTPYQAANKALSKYFRENKENNNEITFSICESTRKSKKSVYTYVGRRIKLDVPVKYKIQDGREIVKQFKNSLKKVKKSDNE